MKKYLLTFLFFLGILTATAQTPSKIPFQDEIDVFIKKDSIAMPAANSIYLWAVPPLIIGKISVIISQAIPLLIGVLGVLA